MSQYFYLFELATSFPSYFHTGDPYLHCLYVSPLSLTQVKEKQGEINCSTFLCNQLGKLGNTATMLRAKQVACELMSAWESQNEREWQKNPEKARVEHSDPHHHQRDKHKLRLFCREALKFNTFCYEKCRLRAVNEMKKRAGPEVIPALRRKTYEKTHKVPNYH